MPDWETFVEDNAERYRRDLESLLRIPSISALPEYSPRVHEAGEWVAGRLRQAGIENVEIIETDRHPVVYGDWLHADGKPTVLIYGHFDVQPVDPISLWSADPFEPVERDGRVYARGTADMKANLLISVEAVEALLRSHSLSVNVKLFIEGEEEIGSPDLPALVKHRKRSLACDVVLSGDGVQWSDERPELTLGMRGGCGVQIDVRGPGTDLHSGSFGGAAPNPIHALVNLLASMRASNGSMAVEGFYDDVVPLSDTERAAFAEIPFDEHEFAGRIGAEGLAGEEGFTPLERMWARPTLEVNGIWGGFQGAGVKTVIPSEAHAKITCRLVPDQDPSRIVDLVSRHVERNPLAGFEVKVEPLPFRANPYLVPADHWANLLLAEVLEDVYGVKPFEARQGGSVPVCEIFLSHLGAYTVSLGFAQEDEGMHAPDEFVRLHDLERGRRVWIKTLERLGAAETT
ncbi:MAG TPA: dipeptidase [Chloroflexi bacterium]|nr:dipeptidase [Chloroflexota bacterium]